MSDISEKFSKMAKNGLSRRWTNISDQMLSKVVKIKHFIKSGQKSSNSLDDDQKIPKTTKNRTKSKSNKIS